MSDLNITITLGGRSYPIRVKPEEEFYLRKAGKKLNEMLKNFEVEYGIHDRIDALSMLSLQVQSKMLKIQDEQEGNDENLTAKIAGLIREIDESL